MELSPWLVVLLVVIIIVLSAAVVALSCKLRQRDQHAATWNQSHSTLGEMPILAASAGRPLGPLGLSRHISNDSSLDSFNSCMEELERAEPVVLGTTSLQQQGLRRPRQNSNEVWHYAWLTELLESIANGDAPGSVLEVDTRKQGTPLFVLAGACPNLITGMQALMYCWLPSSVDFWWVKPDSSGQQLEKETLNKHTKGKFKNCSERGRKHLMPFAERFSRGFSDNVFTYGLDSNKRAFIDVQVGNQTIRMLVYLIWQEAWNMAAFGPKYIEGKLCYQRQIGEQSAHTKLPLFARQYKILNGNVYFDAFEEEVAALLPPEPFQEMHDMVTM
mmetsp:Transcript_132087/g.240346  ORF Transcript_132087/g.240346 Transcript_132087/m.240346 type:complete len:331 (+) Transcript_132087:53-1045(+)